MIMITAKEARKMAKKHNLSAISGVEYEIEKASKEGKLFTSVYKAYINVDVINFLAKNGYSVNSTGNHDYYTVSWEDANIDED